MGLEVYYKFIKQDDKQEIASGGFRSGGYDIVQHIMSKLPRQVAEKVYKKGSILFDAGMATTTLLPVLDEMVTVISKGEILRDRFGSSFSPDAEIDIERFTKKLRSFLNDTPNGIVLFITR